MAIIQQMRHIAFKLILRDFLEAKAPLGLATFIKT